MRGRILAMMMVWGVAAGALAQESQLPLVQEVRARYGATVPDDQLGVLLNEIAWRANGQRADGPWGLSRKESGTRSPCPCGGDVAHDILHYRPTNRLFDVFIAAGEATTPTWQDVGLPPSPDRVWVAPVAPASTPPPPPPPPTDLAALLAPIVARLDLLIAKPVGTATCDVDPVVRELQLQTAALRQALDELRAEVRRGVKVRF